MGYIGIRISENETLGLEKENHLPYFKITPYNCHSIISLGEYLIMKYGSKLLLAIVLLLPSIAAPAIAQGNSGTSNADLTISFPADRYPETAAISERPLPQASRRLYD